MNLVEFVGGPRDGERIAVEDHLASFPLFALRAHGVDVSEHVGNYRVMVWLSVPQREHGIAYYEWEAA